MKAALLIILFLPVIGLANDITILASTVADDPKPASFQLIAGAGEAKIVSMNKGGEDAGVSIGGNTFTTWPSMTIQLASGVGPRIKQFADKHRLKIVRLRVTVDQESYDAVAIFSSPGFGDLHDDVLFVGIPPEEKQK